MSIADPTDLSGLQLWLDGSQETYGDGDGVTVWTDRSGNGNHATQPTPSEWPTYDTTTQAIDFDGSEHLVLPGIFDIGAGSSYVAGYYRETDVGTRYMLAASDFVGNGNKLRWYFSSVTLVEMGLAIGSEAYEQDGPWSLIYPNDDPRRRVWGLRSDGFTGYGSMSCHANQQQDFPAGHGSTLPWGGAASFATLGRHTSAQQWLDGQLFEVVHYNRKLTDAEDADVVGYLMGKWGVNCAGWVVGAVSIG